MATGARGVFRWALDDGLVRGAGGVQEGGLP